MVLRGRSISSLLLIVSFLIVGVPVPADAEDGPTCGVALTPCPVGLGTHEGTLTPHANERDHYALHVPDGPGILSVTGAADVVVEMILRDANGDVRGAGWTLFQSTITMAAASMPDGPWGLEIVYTPFSNPALAGNTYTFSVAWHAMTNGTAFTGPPSAVSTVVGEHVGGEAQVDLILGAVSSARPRAIFEMLWYITPDGGFAGGGASVNCCGYVGSAVKTWGGPVPDLALAVPDATASAAQVGVVTLPLDGYTRFAYGLAAANGAEPIHGYMVWNGDAAPALQMPDNGTSFAHRLHDFDGEGSGVFAAGITHVENVHVTQDLPVGPGVMNAFYVNGESPQGAVFPARFTLTNTTGATTDISGDRAFFFLDEAPGGAWRVDAQHVDGQEADALRFTGASFPLDIEWLLEPLRNNG